MAERVEMGGGQTDVGSDDPRGLLDAGQEFLIYSRKSLKDFRWERTWADLVFKSTALAAEKRIDYKQRGQSKIVGNKRFIMKKIWMNFLANLIFKFFCIFLPFLFSGMNRVPDT